MDLSRLWVRAKLGARLHGETVSKAQEGLIVDSIRKIMAMELRMAAVEAMNAERARCLAIVGRRPRASEAIDDELGEISDLIREGKPVS
jgi:hypothetical protein